MTRAVDLVEGETGRTFGETTKVLLSCVRGRQDTSDGTGHQKAQSELRKGWIRNPCPRSVTKIFGHNLKGQLCRQRN